MGETGSQGEVTPTADVEQCDDTQDRLAEKTAERNSGDKCRRKYVVGTASGSRF